MAQRKEDVRPDELEQDQERKQNGEQRAQGGEQQGQPNEQNPDQQDEENMDQG